MHSLKDYVDLVAKSMAVNLDEKELNRITRSLINNKNHKKMLEDLEAMIRLS